MIHYRCSFLSSQRSSSSFQAPTTSSVYCAHLVSAACSSRSNDAILFTNACRSSPLCFNCSSSSSNERCATAKRASICRFCLSTFECSMYNCKSDISPRSCNWPALVTVASSCQCRASASSFAASAARATASASRQRRFMGDSLRLPTNLLELKVLAERIYDCRLVFALFDREFFFRRRQPLLQRRVLFRTASRLVLW